MNVKKIRALVFIFCLAVTGVLIFNLSNSAMAMVDARKGLEIKKDELLHLQAEIEETKKSIDVYAKERQDFQQYLFEEKDVPVFLESIADFAKKTQINIMDMKARRFESVMIPGVIWEAQNNAARLKEAKAGKAIAEKEAKSIDVTLAAMPIDIRVQGSYANFVQFLSYLEDFKQLLTITNMDINTSGEIYPLLGCAFTLKIYGFKNVEDMEGR